MTPSQFLAAYREEMAPTLGGAYMDGFIARNRAKLLQIIEPVVAMINARAAKAAAAKQTPVESGDKLVTAKRYQDMLEVLPPARWIGKAFLVGEAMSHDDNGQARYAYYFRRGDQHFQGPDLTIAEFEAKHGGGRSPVHAREVEDPDAVTPEKDAIVWAAFKGLVNEKRRAIGLPDLEVTESLPSYKERKRDEARLNVQRHRERIGVGHPIAIMLRHPARRDLIAMVTASANEPGRFQLTWADDKGPSGHTTRDTPEEAVRYAVEEGYRFDSANSSEAREMVEVAERAREARAAEIESWLTESLPSRGRSVGRIGDRGWGSEVAADKLTARSREMASVRHNTRMTGDHAAWSHRVNTKVAALLAARKHHHYAPHSREAVMMVESAEEALARELGGKEHIPLAIETYRWEQEGA
jgi:hypothetical protein